MARRSEHSREELRELALICAEQILDENRNSPISTRQIAAKMGYTVGTLYQLYSNLSELLLHVNSRSLKLLKQDCQQSFNPSEAPIKNIQTFALIYSGFSKNYQYRWQLIFDHQIFVQVSKPFWYREQISSLFQMVEKELIRLKPDIMPVQLRQTAFLIWSAVHGICVLSNEQSMRQNLIDFPIEQDAQIRDFIENYLSGWIGVGD